MYSISPHNDCAEVTPDNSKAHLTNILGAFLTVLSTASDFICWKFNFLSKAGFYPDSSKTTLLASETIRTH